MHAFSPLFSFRDVCENFRQAKISTFWIIGYYINFENSWWTNQPIPELLALQNLQHCALSFQNKVCCKIYSLSSQITVHFSFAVSQFGLIQFSMKYVLIVHLFEIVFNIFSKYFVKFIEFRLKTKLKWTIISNRECICKRIFSSWASYWFFSDWKSMLRSPLNKWCHEMQTCSVLLMHITISFCVLWLYGIG